MKCIRTWVALVALLTGCGGDPFVFVGAGDAGPDELAAADVDATDAARLPVDDAGDELAAADVDARDAAHRSDGAGDAAADVDATDAAHQVDDAGDELAVDAPMATGDASAVDVAAPPPNDAGLIDAGPPPVVCQAYRAPCSGAAPVECIYGTSYECCSGPCPL
jgi:hypothetical protein